MKSVKYPVQLTQWPANLPTPLWKADTKKRST